MLFNMMYKTKITLAIVQMPGDIYKRSLYVQRRNFENARIKIYEHFDTDF